MPGTDEAPMGGEKTFVRLFEAEKGSWGITESTRPIRDWKTGFQKVGGESGGHLAASGVRARVHGIASLPEKKPCKFER